MVIDFHTHIFPARLAPIAIKNLADQIDSFPYFDGTIEGLVKDMDKNKIDISVCMPIITNPKHTQAINDYAIEINNNINNVYSFASLHPDYLDYKSELIRLKNNGIKGIKLHPIYQNFYIDEDKSIELINACIDNGMYVLFHGGLDPGFPGNERSSVKHIVNMLKKVKSTDKIIIAHLGGLFEWDEVMEYIASSDCYLDCAMSFDCLYKRDGSLVKLIDKDLFIELLNKHGSDKILFGSDNPWTKSCYGVEYINNLDISDDDKENILYKNACKILGIEVNKNE